MKLSQTGFKSANKFHHQKKIYGNKILYVFLHIIAAISIFIQQNLILIFYVNYYKLFLDYKDKQLEQRVDEFVYQILHKFYNFIVLQTDSIFFYFDIPAISRCYRDIAHQIDSRWLNHTHFKIDFI